jgi:flagellum-specific peptidoglycan hydrolase FlgJ
MLRRTTLIIAFLMVCFVHCRAQMASGYFHTIGQGERYGKVVVASDFPRDSIAMESSQPSEQEAQMVKPKATASLKKYPRTRSYRNWEERELTMLNLLKVIREVGLTNGLIVLAQALLETGYFSSRVCKEYNNLFGLYDSKNREYFRFARWEDSVVAYQRMIQYKYKGGNYFQFLKRIGYAEDPRYLVKLAKVVKSIYKDVVTR